ncbi:MAG: glutamyl-tRNA reductase, partial [Gammaproteobacteria bacterium]|nr:glutamyl-tRNA reductase [Gammaproteobacteria bacterium]
MHLFAFGINHQSAPLEVREQVVFDPTNMTRALRDLVDHRPVREAAILSTCNRTEVYCNTEQPVEAVHWLADFHRLDRTGIEPYVYRLDQERAVSHAFRVASGLDSAVI